MKRILLLQTILLVILIGMVARLYWQQAQPQTSSGAEETPESRDTVLVLDTLPQRPVLSGAAPDSTPKSVRRPSVPKEEPQPEPPKTRPVPNEEERKYYSNGKLSVLISPWKEGRRTWKLYDLYGNETIELEEVRLSYSVSYDARFHPNGAVQVIHFSENPGAANFWYEGEMEFSTTNEPITRRVRRMPVESLEEMVHRKWVYWDKRTKSWREQETME